MRSVILCADDYARNPAITKGILQLAIKGRISATSCMTTFEHWPTAAVQLKPISSNLDVGLHLNLTEGRPLTPYFPHTDKGRFYSLGKLMQFAFTKRLNEQALHQELNAQIEMFIKHFGCPPDFIDGHQYVHQLPVVRKVCVALAKKMFPRKRPYVRVASSGWVKDFQASAKPVKSLVIALTGAPALKQMLFKARVPFNRSFSGIYAFKHSEQYASLFPKFLRFAKDKGIVVCHPGLGSSDLTDPIRDYRQKEFEYLSSEQFLKDCEYHEVKISRFRATRH